MIYHKASLESGKVPQKIWARLVQPFWRLLDINKQTSYIYLQISMRKENYFFVKNFKRTMKENVQFFTGGKVLRKLFHVGKLVKIYTSFSLICEVKIRILPISWQTKWLSTVELANIYDFIKCSQCNFNIFQSFLSWFLSFVFVII